MKIADASGKWYQSAAHFNLVDPESGTCFEPGEPTRATATAWVKGQPAIVEVADPMAPAEVPAEPPVVKTAK